MSNEFIHVNKGNPGDIVTIMYADHTEEHFVYMPGHGFCDGFGSDGAMAIPGFFIPDGNIVSIDFRSPTEDEGLSKIDADTVTNGDFIFVDDDVIRLEHVTEDAIGINASDLKNIFGVDVDLRKDGVIIDEYDDDYDSYEIMVHVPRKLLGGVDFRHVTIRNHN